MDAAVPTRSLWWTARQWLRLLTGLAALAVVLGAGPRGIDQTSIESAPRAASVSAASIPAASAEATIQIAAGSVTSGAARVLIVEPDPVPLAPASVPRQQWPAQPAGPDSAVVSPVGQRAPPDRIA